MKDCDIVIPYKATDSEELRYCLRSLKNIPHRNVFICGDKPDYISDKVIYIPRTETGKTAQHDSELNLRNALFDTRLSDEFVLMNDDFFIMRKITELPNYHAGDIDEFIKARTSPMFAFHNKALLNSKRLIESDNKLSYELHIPMLMDKYKRIEVSNLILPHLAKKSIILPRSIYGSLFCDTSTRKKDVKVYKADDAMPSGVFVSTFNKAFCGIAGDTIKAKFHEKSRYEA